MNKSICRIYHYVFSRTLRLFEHISPVIIEGEDSLLSLLDICKEKQIKKILLITSSGTLKRKTIDPLLEALKGGNVEYVIYSDVKPDPTVESVEDGLKTYLDNKCEAIVMIGGGSAIDLGKVIGARIVRPNKKVSQMKGLLKVRRKLPLLIAAPTTAGTGSEVTAAAVITDTKNGTHYKYAVSDFCLIPSYAILDPKLTITLPSFISVTTGLDALTHALEAYTNLFASKYVKKNALDACKLIFENIDIVSKDPTNLEARNNMLLGSTYAGIAFTNNFVGNVHALAHGIGGIYGVSHGEANSVLLVPVLKQYGSAVYKTLAEVADYCGLKGNSDEEKANAVFKKIDEIKETNNIPFVFDKLDEKDYEEIIERAMSEAIPSYPTPVIWDKEDYVTVLNSVRKQ